MKNFYIRTKLTVMKKLLLIVFILITGTNINAQLTAAQESKMLQAMGGLSAAYLYNTYSTIGSVADGFSGGVYTDKETTEILDNQKQMCDNLIKMMKGLLDDKVLNDERDVDFMKNVISIVTGLKKQAQYYEDYMANKNDDRKSKYDDQRKENWNGISKVLGLE